MKTLEEIALEVAGRTFTEEDGAYCHETLIEFSRRLIAHPEVIAAIQQQTAEACAKAAVVWGNARKDDNGGHALRNYAESLRSGEWRKYLKEPSK